jgi:hypothetical protein
MPPAPASAATRALQAALAAEQAAAYGYGIVGSHLDSASLATAQADWTAHQKGADKLSALLRDRGATPAPAAVAYQLPHHVTTAAQATALAITLEDQVTTAYLALVALPDTSLRLLGARQARAAALRAAAWRTTTVAFPGLQPISHTPRTSATHTSATHSSPAATPATGATDPGP